MYQKIAIFLFVIFCFVSCNNDKKKESIIDADDIEDTTNNTSKLDFEGVYQGILPCEDCAGEVTQIILQDDGTYMRSTRKLGVENSSSHEQGTYNQNKDGVSITLSDGTTYMVGNGKIVKLLEGESDQEAYTLSMKNVDIYDTVWKLTTINDDEVKAPSDELVTPFLLLKEDGKFVGSSGCNSIFGQHSIGKNLQIEFSGVGATKKACGENAIERAYLMALKNVVSYDIESNSLVLYNEDVDGILEFVPDFISDIK